MNTEDFDINDRFLPTMITNEEITRRRDLWSQGYWEIPDNIDTANFDFSWRPSPVDRPYIHEFGTQWQKTGGPRFIVPNSEGTKYHDTQRVTALPTPEKFKVLVDYPIDFDYSWHPDSTVPPFIYTFSDHTSQLGHSTLEVAIEYHMPGAIDRKHVAEVYSRPAGDVLGEWKILLDIDQSIEFDYSWRPDPKSPPYIWVFGTKWNSPEIEPILEFRVVGATNKMYVTDVFVTLSIDYNRWTSIVPGATIDYSWRPSPYEPPYIWVFGNKWNSAETEPTIEYTVPGATEKKYINYIHADVPVIQSYWSNLSDNTFDYSWRPNPYAPAHVYQWENNGPIYTVPGAEDIVLMKRTEKHSVTVQKYYIETTLEDLILEHSNEVFWALNPELNHDNFNFNWSPNDENFLHINTFGNEQSTATKIYHAYYVNGPAYMLGHREYNYIENNVIEVITDIDMFYIVRGNNDAGYIELKERFPKLQKTRYLNSWVDTILRCTKRANSKLVWILSSEVDYTEFKFDFYPAIYQRDMIHVFGTQWSHWGNTYLINTQTFADTVGDVRVIEHCNGINHVTDKRAKITTCSHDVVIIEQCGQSANITNKTLGTVTVLKYEISYLETLTRWAQSLDPSYVRSEHYVWVLSDICDYSRFDFTWQSDPFQREQLHVFASSIGTAKQKFGDTFLIDLNALRAESWGLEYLQNYSKLVNYIEYISAPRLSHPVIHHTNDSQATAIKSIENKPNFPYIELINDDSVLSLDNTVVPVLWHSHQTPIISVSEGSSRIFVPRVAIDFIYNEVYDYHNIEFSKTSDKSKPLDIIFFSNGEPIAQENYDHLEQLIKKKNLPNRLVWVKDVAGRVASQHAAAHASNTPWYFLVNCKLRVNEDFNFGWQPDRLQHAKHYIFMATNPVNDLEYGHQAIVANNKQLTLNTEVTGLDFTMESLHQVINKNSGVALYNTDPWTTWRTAFREVIKLKYDADRTGNFETIRRIEAWMTVGHGEMGRWSIEGAIAASNYYESVVGDLDELMNSYDWQWIQEYYHKLYNS